MNQIDGQIDPGLTFGLLPRYNQQLWLEAEVQGEESSASVSQTFTAMVSVVGLDRLVGVATSRHRVQGAKQG